MSYFNTPTKIETIVQCYLRNGHQDGEFGSLHKERGKYAVIVDGMTFEVRIARGGWVVSRGSFAGFDRNLYTAAHHVCDAIGITA